MTYNLKPYPAYKDSGVEWLGEMPAHWEVQKLGRIGHFFKGSGGTKEDEVTDGFPCVRYGDIYTQHQFFIRNSRACITDKRAINYTPIQYGDVLFAGSGETIDEIGKSAVNLIAGPAYCGGDVIVFRPSIETDAGFLGYATDCPQAAYQKSCMGRGFTVMHIYGNALKSLIVALPPLPEQTAIVRYLDHCTVRIDRLIAAKEKLITLLEEQKQAVVHQAVTGQTDVRTGKPYPAYKDSGVEWLGEMPGHWEVRRLKSCVANVVDMVDECMPIGLYVAMENVESWTGKIINSDNSTAFAGPAKRFRKRDVLFGKLRPYLAKVARPNRSGVCVSEFFVLRPSVIGILAQYLQYWCLSKAVIDVIDGSTFGARMPRADWMFVGSMDFSIPPLPEQTAIVRYLDQATANIANTIARTRHQIDLLREYRTCLIADVVTGKLDVREAAACLPEVNPLADDEGPDAVLDNDADAGLNKLDPAMEEAEA